MYAQLSYINGFIKYDLNASTTLAIVHEPFSAAAANENPDNYPLNSAHHGLALSGDGTKLCDGGGRCAPSWPEPETHCPVTARSRRTFYRTQPLAALLHSGWTANVPVLVVMSASPVQAHLSPISRFAP
jgi:hypothetical protein